jgi:hypothetical protein
LTTKSVDAAALDVNASAAKTATRREMRRMTV